MCGITSKLLNPDFVNLIKSYDILIFTETKTDELDDLKLPNEYSFYAKHRKKFKRKSGGIVVVYRNLLSKFLNLINSESEFVQWVEICKNISNLNERILLGCIYIPPEYTRYSTDESFIEIEDELIKFSGKTKNIALIGDFNARTSTLLDYIILDENLLEILDVDDFYENNENIFSYLQFVDKNISLERYSKDIGRVNKYGTMLLELCKRSGIFICNGRIFADKNIGHTTCKDSSLVDYLIMSPCLFNIVSDFVIDDFNPMFSDVHNRLSFSFSFPSGNILEKSQHTTNSTCNTYVRWDNRKADDFIQVLSNDTGNSLQQLNDVLNSVDIDTITSESVNKIVNNIGHVLLETADTVFGKPKKTPYNPDHENKPWFNKECRDKRDQFNKSRHAYNRVKSGANKTTLNQTAREYRKVLQSNHQKYKDKCSKELRTLSKHDTKTFWKTLRKFSNIKKNSPSIDIDTFYEYFKDLNAGEDEDLNTSDFDINEICNNPIYDEILNGTVSELEISEAINKLKNNKAPGSDKILNEFLKYSPPDLVSLYCKLFNIVLDTGIIPDTWTNGIIKPLYKNKGNPLDPDNFRAITLISCLGKLFTSIINTRLNIFANEISLISENQAGFRKGYATTDNIFVLHALVELYFSFGKKLFCTFIDFRKAFDTVLRSGLWQKLHLSEIKGKCFKVIFNMYQGIKSCVQYNGEQSDFFPCLIGVRQGENLSPFLFSIFLNDLEQYFRNLDGIPLESLKQKFENELHIFFELFVVLYADDTVIFSETKEGMQNSLDIFQIYCETWKLKVNVTKTKVMVFSKRKNRQNLQFILQNELLEIVDSFSYLGIIFKYNGTFFDTKKKLVDQAQKALFYIYKIIRNEAIPIDLQCKIFDSMIEPILLYGSEVWGFENLKIIEQTHLKFCKRVLKVRNTTPNFMVYGELGRFPLEVKIKVRMTSYWCKLVNNESKLCSLLYRLMLGLKLKTRYAFKWVNFVESIFNSSGSGFIFANQTGYCDKLYLKQTLCDQFIQQWFSEIENSSRGQFYSIFKKEFTLEKYLLKLPESCRIWITKFRCSNLRFPIETGRWQNIPKQDRICTLCRDNIGDEFHLLFKCSHQNIVDLREKFLPRYFSVIPTYRKMDGLFSLCNVALYKRLSVFIKKIANMF